MMAQPTAAISGLPLKVPPWSPGSKQETRFRRDQRGKRYAPAQPFAERHDVGLDAEYS